MCNYIFSIGANAGKTCMKAAKYGRRCGDHRLCAHGKIARSCALAGCGCVHGKRLRDCCRRKSKFAPVRKNANARVSTRVKTHVNTRAGKSTRVRVNVKVTAGPRGVVRDTGVKKAPLGRKVALPVIVIDEVVASVAPAPLAAVSPPVVVPPLTTTTRAHAPTPIEFFEDDPSEDLAVDSDSDTEDDLNMDEVLVNIMVSMRSSCVKAPLVNVGFMDIDA